MQSYSCITSNLIPLIAGRNEISSITPARCINIDSKEDPSCIYTGLLIQVVFACKIKGDGEKSMKAPKSLKCSFRVKHVTAVMNTRTAVLGPVCDTVEGEREVTVGQCKISKMQFNLLQLLCKSRSRSSLPICVQCQFPRALITKHSRLSA